MRVRPEEDHLPPLEAGRSAAGQGACSGEGPLKRLELARSVGTAMTYRIEVRPAERLGEAAAAKEEETKVGRKDATGYRETKCQSKKRRDCRN